MPPVDRDDPYVTVQCTFRRATKAAVQIEDAHGDPHWIPRSCLHGASDIVVNDAAEGDEVELQIRAWIAKREGL